MIRWLWFLSVLTQIVTGAPCAAYFDYTSRWIPLDFCFNSWDSRRKSSKLMCNADKTNLTMTFYDNFDCNEADVSSIKEDYRIISELPSDETVVCQQDAALCAADQIAVVNEFKNLSASACSSGDFSGAPDFKQIFGTSTAINICFDYPSDAQYNPDRSRIYYCNDSSLVNEVWSAWGCAGGSGSLYSSYNALTYDTCTPAPTGISLDIVVTCGSVQNSAIAPWSLTDYPLNPSSTTPAPFNYNWSYNESSGYTSSAGVAGLFAFFTFMCCCCSICGVFMIIMCCILRCLKGKDDGEDGAVAKITLCIYYIFWFLLFLPLKACAFGCKKIFFCRGCSMDIAKKFFSFLPNLISTIIILSRFGKAKSGIDFEAAAAEGVATFAKVDAKIVQGLTIIIFVCIGFGIKAKELYISHQVAKDKESAIVKSYQIKNLQALIITSSDTMFKIFSGIAIMVGSDFSGTDNDGMKNAVVGYIKGAAVVGMLVEFIDLADEYLTKIFMFVPKQEVSTDSGFSCSFNADTVQGELSGQLNVDQLEPGEPAQSVQKTILWNALWAGLKLFMLLIEQLFAFIAACILAGSGDVIGFLVIVIIFILADIVLAGIMCTKYQRLSVGLFCKYYLCCFYNQCKSHCERYWIKLDPVEKDLRFDAFGGVTNIKTTPEEMAGNMAQQIDANTENAENPGDGDGAGAVDLIVSEKAGDGNKVDVVDENKDGNVDENKDKNDGNVDKNVDENKDGNVGENKDGDGDEDNNAPDVDDINNENDYAIVEIKGDDEKNEDGDDDQVIVDVDKDENLGDQVDGDNDAGDGDENVNDGDGNVNDGDENVNDGDGNVNDGDENKAFHD